MSSARGDVSSLAACPDTATTSPTRTPGSPAQKKWAFVDSLAPQQGDIIAGGTKALIQSTTAWGALVAGLVALAQLVGYTISPADQATIVKLIESGYAALSSVIALAGAAVARWGRIYATKQIGGIIKRKT
ncbi:MAG TPA: hypothetical protein VM755_19800 [Stellaceae bacterium]|nr:hypothetical protein [Stellaceae bacterium]